MSSRCARHSFETATVRCSMCFEPFCDECVVYVHGAGKPPLCVRCALVAAGVRRLTPAEKKAMKANRERAVAVAGGATAGPPPAPSGWDGAFDAPVGDAPAADAGAGAQPAAAADRGPARVQLALVAAAVGLVLVLAPFLTNGF